MSDSYRDTLFSDIDKIMAQQGYGPVPSSSEPIEVEATSEMMHRMPTVPSDLNLNLTPSFEPETTQESTPASTQETTPASVPTPEKSESVRIQTEAGPVAAPAPEPMEDPVKEIPPVFHAAPEPVPNKPEPVKETVMPPDTEASPMFTTIENPMEWKMESEQTEPQTKTGEKEELPPVSYLEGAQSDGYSVENVAFGDISVGVETESVEFSVGHPLLRLLRNILICVAAALVLSLLITKFIAHHTSVDGSSMETTLSDGDQLIVEQLSYYFHDPQRFDVVVFPISTEDNYIKRIIGLPGETVQIKDGQVYINGVLLTDDHYGQELMDDPGMASDTIFLQADEYFVLGDNRNASVDSRFPEVGLIKKKDIKGKAWLRFYPFGSFGTIG